MLFFPVALQKRRYATTSPRSCELTRTPTSWPAVVTQPGFIYRLVPRSGTYALEVPHATQLFVGVCATGTEVGVGGLTVVNVVAVSACATPVATMPSEIAVTTATTPTESPARVPPTGQLRKSAGSDPFAFTLRDEVHVVCFYGFD